MTTKRIEFADDDGAVELHVVAPRGKLEPIVLYLSGDRLRLDAASARELGSALLAAAREVSP